MPRIADGEYQDRLKRLRSEVARAGLDRFLVTSFDSIYYLTGAGFEPLERPFFLIIPPPGADDPALLVPRLDAEHMRKAHGIMTIHTYWDCPSPKGRRWKDVLSGLLGKARRIGVEPSLSGDIAEALRDRSPDALPLVERLRLVKSPGEVAMIRRAAHYADWAVEQLLGASYPGATVAEGFARTGAVTRKIIREVANWEILTTRVLMATWAAPRSARPHSIPALGDRLRGGPHVALALLRVNGYAAESERTYFTTRPTPEMRRAYRAMLEARSIAFRMVRPGVACREIDAAVSEFLRTEGYSGEERRLHRTGHGIGLGNHEAHWIAVGSDEVLAENMVISIEPGIYLEGESPGGFRHSDTVLVTSDGFECLTRLPTALGSLDQCGFKLLARVRGLLVRRALRFDWDREPRAEPTETGSPSQVSGNPSVVDRGSPCPEAEASLERSGPSRGTVLRGIGSPAPSPGDPTTGTVRMAGKRRRVAKIMFMVLLAAVAMGLVLAAGVWIVVRRSLPAIDGEIALRGPIEPIRIERDRQGVPTIRAEGRVDLAFGLGFVHGQDRFFQMDSLRRYAAGELSEILGPGSQGECVTWDRRIRVMQFRSVARRVVADLDDSDRRQLDAYVAGGPGGDRLAGGPPVRVPDPRRGAEALDGGGQRARRPRAVHRLAG
jgi:Xaa-Pro dipeptidase